MRIERIEVRKLALPLKHPFETSFGTTTRKEFLLVTASAGGVSGYGECVADEHPYYLPETNETAWHILRDFLAPLLLASDIEHPREVSAVFSRVRGHNMAKAALEMAVWDLAARRRDRVRRLDRPAAGRSSAAAQGGRRGGRWIPPHQDKDQART